MAPLRPARSTPCGFPLLTQNTWEVFSAGNETTEQNQLETIARMAGMGLEGSGWTPAGSRAAGHGGREAGSPGRTISLRACSPVGDAAHKAGLKFVLWFEPERVADGSLIAQEHPCWLLSRKDGRGHRDSGPAVQPRRSRGAPVDDGLFLQVHSDWGVDVYRQDRNFYPFQFWRDNDPPDRQGITEIRHVEGLVRHVGRVAQAAPGIDDRQCQLAGHGPRLGDSKAVGRLLDVQRGRPTAVRIRSTTRPN